MRQGGTDGRLLVITTGGTYVFAIGVTDSVGAYAEREYTVDIPVITKTSPLPRATQNVAYSTAITAQSPEPVTFTSTALPPGMKLHTATGFIAYLAGTTAIVGSFKFDITATDPVGRKYTKTYQLNVDNPLLVTTTDLPMAVKGTLYSTTLTGSGGYPPYTWSLDAGILPADLKLEAATGKISGIPKQQESQTITMTIHDSINRTTSKQLTLNVGNDLSLPALTLARGIIGTGYSTGLVVSGGAPPYRFYQTSGTLPPDITLNENTGLLSGTARALGVYPFNVTVYDAYNNPATTSFTIYVDPVFAITTNSLNTVVANTPYNQTLNVEGGTAPYTWSIVAGSLTSGLSLNSTTGVISGTPTTFVTQWVTIGVRDAGGQFISKQFIPPLTLHSTSMPNGLLNEYYSESLVVSGGLPLYLQSDRATANSLVARSKHRPYFRYAYRSGSDECRDHHYRQ